jgi:hypothetical protein
MNPLACLHPSLRPLALAALALAAPACLPGSLSLGDDGGDTDPDTGSEPGDSSDSADSGDSGNANEPDERWSTIRPDITGTDVAVAPDGSFYVIGQSGYTPQGDGGFYDDRWLARFDANGVLQWELFEPQPFEDFVYPVAISLDAAGNLYVALIDYDVTVDGDNRVLQLGPDGTELWSTSIPGRLGDVVALPEGGAIAVGSQDGSAWAQALDADGVLGWSRTFEGLPMTYSEITEAALTGDGGVALGGRLGIEVGSSRSRAWAATLELVDGADRWQTLLSDGVITDRVVGMGVAADGTMLVAGWSDTAWVKALDPSGAVQWTWVNDVAPGTESLAVFPDGGFAVGDGLLVDPEDAENCLDGLGPCPSTMRVERRHADRTPTWSFATTECHTALAVTPTPDGGLLTMAACYYDDPSLAMGLYLLEP